MKIRILFPLLLSAALMASGCSGNERPQPVPEAPAAAGEAADGVSQMSFLTGSSPLASIHTFPAAGCAPAVKPDGVSADIQSLTNGGNASGNASGSARDKDTNPLLGDWEANPEATVDALMKIGEAKLSGDELALWRANASSIRGKMLEKLGDKDVKYTFNADGTGKVVSKAYGNGTVKWSVDGDQLKMKVIDQDGQVFDKSARYDISDGNLKMYADDVAAIFSRPSAAGADSKAKKQKAPNNYKMYAEFPDVIDFGEYCTFINNDATESYAQGDARGYVYYVLRKNGDELKQVADYILANTSLGFQITDSKTADDGAYYILRKDKMELHVLMVDVSDYYMQVLVVMGNG